MPPRKRKSKPPDFFSKLSLDCPCKKLRRNYPKTPSTYQLRACSDGSYQYMPTFADLIRMYEEDERKARVQQAIKNKAKKSTKKLAVRSIQSNENNHINTNYREKLNYNQEYIIMVKYSEELGDQNQCDVIYMSPAMLPRKLCFTKPQNITGNVVVQNGHVNFNLNFKNKTGIITQGSIDITRFFTTADINSMESEPKLISEVSEVFGSNNTLAAKEGYITQSKLIKPPHVAKHLGQCPICLELIGSKTTVCTLCGHMFCFPCIKSSLDMGKDLCPTCRRPIRLLHALYF